VKLILIRVYHVSIYEVLDSYWIVNLIFFKKKKYLQIVESFINFVLFNSNNISENKIRCPCAKCKNKKFHYKDVVMMHQLKRGFIEKYLN